MRAGSTQTPVGEQVLDAVTYLCNNYNDAIDLTCNSPDDSDTQLNNTYYIYSDNYLASLVLWKYGQSTLDSDLTGKAVNITNAIENQTDKINPINQYMVLTMAHTVNESVFNASKNFILNTTDDGAIIKTTQNNQSGNLSQSHYTDIAFLKAIYYHELGRDNDAIIAYNDGFDDAVYLTVGMGFKDDAFNGNYETYKVALYILASNWLGLDYDLQALETLRKMQNLVNGGFVAYYDSDLNHVGSTNAETTSLAVLSLIPLPLEPIPEFGMMPLVVMSLLVTIVIAGEARRRKAS